MKRKRRKKKNTVEVAQSTVRLISTTAFMASRAFVAGFLDARRGQPFDYEFIDTHLRDAAKYESGRLFAVATRNIELSIIRVGQKWKRKAFAYHQACWQIGVFPPAQPRKERV